jgi:hypothetical protein
MERINATTGMQECVQICSGGGQEWTTRWFGDRSMFPRVARVNKRTLEEGGLANGEEMEEEMEEEADVGELATPMNKERPIKGGRRVVPAPEREMERMNVKQEEGNEDLFSLCGRVQGLDVQSVMSGSFLR